VTETNVFQLSQPGTFSDPLTEVLRNGARALLAQAVEAEVSSLLSCHADKLTDDGRRRLVRHGHLPEREIMTGIGPIAVRCPRVRDRGGEGSERIRFLSTILPPYARRSKSLEVLIPILYLKGISTGDFEDALIALLGRDAVVRHGAPPHRALQRMSLKQDRARHDLQARRGCRKKLASPQWPQPVAENHPRDKVHRRDQDCQIASSNRCRLIPSVTKIRR
jgi:putative transposase